MTSQWCCYSIGSRHELVVPVKKESHFIVWKFDLEEHDIDFSVSFSIDPQWALRQPSDAGYEDDGSLLLTVHSRTRYLATTTGRPVEGTCTCLLWGFVTYADD